MGLFKTYDIRGIYGKELDEQFTYNLGKCIIQFTKPASVVIGYDSRTSNLKLFSALAKSLTEQGIDVVHAGLVTRPMLNWVAYSSPFDLGIMISASHNLREYNGFKLLWKGKPIGYENGLNIVEKMYADNIYERIKPTKKKGKIISHDYIDAYVEFLSRHFTKDAKKKRLNIVADASNGAAGEIIRRLFERNNFAYTPLFEEPDGNFPCHNPNPVDDHALIILSLTVKKEKADLGFMVDPDADRIRFVDNRGVIVENSYIQALVAKYFITKKKNHVIVHELTARRVYSEIIRRSHGTEIVSRVGSSFIPALMKEHGAWYGSEESGHNYFKEFNYLDSGLMMLVYTLNLLAHEQKQMSTLLKPLSKYVDLGELDYTVDHKDECMQRIKQYFVANKKKYAVKKIITIDGIGVVMPNVWFIIRPSNTEPLLRVRIEGKTKKVIENMRARLEKFIRTP